MSLSTHAHAMRCLFLTAHPAWLVSPPLPNEAPSCPTTNASTIDPTTEYLNYMRDLAPQPQLLSSVTLPHPQGHDLDCARPDTSQVWVIVPPQCPSDNKSVPCPRVPSTKTGRVEVPLPFAEDYVTNTVLFSSRGRRGLSLAEWARLSERRMTHLAIDNPHESLDELFSIETRVLFQSHWPGYNARTCFLDMPVHVTEGDRAFTRVNLLDMVCTALVDWVVKVTNDRHVECREPKWAIGLNEITFKHINLVSVVEIKGYVPKWVPVLEIDPRVFHPRR